MFFVGASALEQPRSGFGPFPQTSPAECDSPPLFRAALISVPSQRPVTRGAGIPPRSRFSSPAASSSGHRDQHEISPMRDRGSSRFYPRRAVEATVKSKARQNRRAFDFSELVGYFLPVWITTLPPPNGCSVAGPPT